MKLPIIFTAIVEYGIALGLKDIAKLPGCWESQVDAEWWIAVNGHNQPIECSTGATVPPFTAYIQFNGWPAGLVNAQGGTIAGGAIANEQTFVDALKQARRKVA